MEVTMNTDFAYRILAAQGNTRSANQRQNINEQRRLKRKGQPAAGRNRTSFESMLRQEFGAREIVQNPVRSLQKNSLSSSRIALQHNAINALDEYWAE